MIHGVLRAAALLQKTAASPAETAALLVGGAIIGAGITHGIRGGANRQGVLDNISQAKYQAAMDQWSQQLQAQREESLNKLGHFPGMSVLKSAALAPIESSSKFNVTPTSLSLGTIKPSAKSVATDGKQAQPGLLTAKMGAAVDGWGFKAMKDLTKRDRRPVTEVPKAEKQVPATPGKEAVAADKATKLMVGAGVGGLGGYAIGKNVIAPGLEDVARKAADAAKAVPIGGAVVGALLIAALVAIHQSKKDEAPMPPRGGVPVWGNPNLPIRRV